MISTFFNNATTDYFKQFTLGEIDNFIIVNDGANSLELSQDGKSTKGYVYPGESLEFKNVGNKCSTIPFTLYIKSKVIATPTSFRLWGW